MTKAVGKEVAKYDIAINVITPATAKTRILEELKPEFIDYMLSRIPRGRFLEVEEAANMLSWLGEQGKQLHQLPRSSTSAAAARRTKPFRFEGHSELTFSPCGRRCPKGG